MMNQVQSVITLLYYICYNSRYHNLMLLTRLRTRERHSRYIFFHERVKIYVFVAFFNETKGRIRKKRRLFLFHRLRKHLSKDEMGQSGDHSVRHNRPATFLAISKQHRWHSCEKLQMDLRSLLSVQVSILLFLLYRFISSISTFIWSLAETLKFDS